jgi:hypothetical protein
MTADGVMGGRPGGGVRAWEGGAWVGTGSGDGGGDHLGAHGVGGGGQSGARSVGGGHPAVSKVR